MTNRPHSQSTTADLVDQAGEALRTGDKEQYEAIRAELSMRRRTGRRALEELDVLAKEIIPGEAVLSARRVVEGGAAFTVLFDDEIEAERLAMVKRATRSLLLTTYVYRDGKNLISPALIERVRAGVSVTLVVSSGQAKRKPEPLQELSEEGVDVRTGASQHTKCVIVDGREVLIGSANLTKIHRDVMLLVESEELASALDDYVTALEARR